MFLEVYMGARLTKFEFKPKPNEEIDVVIKVPKETRSALHGVVVDCCGKPVKNAVVKLFLKESTKNDNNNCFLRPLTHTFTDECGQFLFGPLSPCKSYVVKVWYSDPICNKEVFVHPEECTKDSTDYIDTDCDDHSYSRKKDNVEQDYHCYYHDEVEMNVINDMDECDIDYK
jgi:hypothetical protein